MGHMGALMWFKKKKKKSVFLHVKLTCIKLRDILGNSFQGLEVHKPANK